MREIENIASALFDKIRTRFENVSLGDENSKATTDPEKARFFNFDYEVNGQKVGNLTISLIDENSLKIYYGKEIVDRLQQLDAEDEGDPEQQWYDFLRALRSFAKRNLLSFDTRDIAKSNLQLKDIKQQSKSDATLEKDDLSVTESRMYGTSRSSYQECGPTKIIVRHTDNVDEEKRGSRTRNIDAVFVETHLGERFLLPFKNLHGARAMAQHCSQGGRIDDDLGEGICNMVQEMNAMSHFVREAKRRQFEDAETGEMANAAVRHYGELKNQLRHIGGRRGYAHYKECWMPTPDIEEDMDVAALRERFVKKVYNDKFDEALPYVYRAYKNQKARKETPMAEEFESWANNMTEAAFAEPDMEDMGPLDKVLSRPRIRVGNNGDDAIGSLHNIIGDDALFDKFSELANMQGPDADAKPLIIQWLRDNNYPDVADHYDTEYTQDTDVLDAQDHALSQQQQEIDSVNRPHGGDATADPSPAMNYANEDSDPLDFIRSLAGLNK